MVRLDMSEFLERHSVARMIGAPPGYVGYEEGGALTEAVRRRPHSVVLLDEVEKAHPDVFHLLLQILDDGRLTDGQGHVVDFTQTLVLMTSNLADEEAVRHHFRPEFLNRLDEVIAYDPLQPGDLVAIVDVLLARVGRSLAAKDMQLDVTQTARVALVEEGWSPEYGARPLKRTIQRRVQNLMASAILKGELLAGDTARIDFGDDGFGLEVVRPTPRLARATA